MTFPFPMVPPSRKILGSQIDRTTGTNIGDMTGVGGLAASFDGSPGTNAQSSYKAGTDGYVGKTLAVSKSVWQVIAYPSTNLGFTDTVPNVTVEFYGKQGSVPANSTDGTLLGTTGSIADTTTEQTILSSDVNTIWDHVWARNVPSASGDIYFSEIQFYESI